MLCGQRQTSVRHARARDVLWWWACGRFSSTSLLWGHNTFKTDEICLEGCREIEQRAKSGGTTQVVLSTPNIQELYGQWGRTLTSAMQNFCGAMDRRRAAVAFGFRTEFHSKEYYLLFRVAHEEEFYKVTFLNAPLRSHVAPFDGRIQVQKLLPHQYATCVAEFDDDAQRAMPLPETIQELKDPLV